MKRQIILLDKERDLLKITKLIAWFGLLAMVAVLMYGFIIGDFSRDGAELLANPWGIVSIVDLYVGFILFSIWIAFREMNKPLAAIWIVMMMVFGFLTASVYIVFNLYQSKGDWPTFFLGARKAEFLGREG